EAFVPPRRRAIVRPHLDTRDHLSWLDHEIGAAHGCNLFRHTVEIFRRELRKQVEIEAGESFDALLRHISDELFRLAVECDVTNRDEDVLRTEPAAGIDDNVVGDGLRREDKSLELSQFFSCRVIDREIFKRLLRPVEVVNGNVLQTWTWMIHGKHL